MLLISLVKRIVESPIVVAIWKIIFMFHIAYLASTFLSLRALSVHFSNPHPGICQDLLLGSESANPRRT